MCELETAGFPDPRVLPIPVNPEKWNFPPDPTLMAQLQDGRKNILFVGRVAPNKKQDDLVTAFDAYLKHDPNARLILAGRVEDDDPYASRVLDLIDAFDLKDAVIVAGSVTDTHLAAFYRTADLFWSMSEHEGFCVPLIEAMWFDVPILAYKSSAVPETLGSAGLLFNDKSRFRELGALAHVLITDHKLRSTILCAQRQRRNSFLSQEIRPTLFDLVGRLTEVKQSRLRAAS